MKVIKTGDGSTTIYLEHLDEQYHSLHGAVNESNHVFINHGLQYVAESKQEISILEMGFGTGLNALLTLLNSEGLKVNYTSLEKFPIEEEVIAQLDFWGDDQKAKEDFGQLHQAKWNTTQQITSAFSLNKLHVGLEEFEPKHKFDLIYYDAFAPKVQPELWTVDIFRKCFDLLNENGILVTYCAQGQVKRNMKEVGFKVEALPGPPGKREMTRAIKLMG